MNYFTKISSTAGDLKFVRPDGSATSTISATNIALETYLDNQHLKIIRNIPGGVAPVVYFSVLSSGQVAINSNTTDVLNPYKFGVNGDSSLTGNILISGTISANSLYFTSTTAIGLSVTGESLNILGSLSITGDNIVPLNQNMLEIYKGGTSTDPSFFVSSAGNSSMSGSLSITSYGQQDSEGITLRSVYSAASNRYAALKLNLPDDAVHTTNRRSYIGYGYSDFTSGNAFVQKMFRGLGIDCVYGDINIGTETPYNVNFITNNDPIPKFIVSSARNVSVSGDLQLTGNLYFPTRVRNATTSGIIYLGSTRLMHLFYPALGGFGANMFIGLNAGNFTTSGTLAYEAGGNMGIGSNTLNSIRNGYANIAIGDDSQYLCTSGAGNVTVGGGSFYSNISSSNNTGVGGNTGYYNTGQYNVFIGSAAGNGNPSTTTANSWASQNICVGAFAGRGITTANGNMYFGYFSGSANMTGGQNVALGMFSFSAATAGSYNIMIGASVQSTSLTSGNELNIGKVIQGTGMFTLTSRVGIGLASATAATALLHLTAGNTSASSAPLKFTSGALNSNAEVGAIEFLTDSYYATITTGSNRKEITLSDKGLTLNRIPYITTNGRLTDAAGFNFDGITMTANSISALNVTAMNALFLPAILTGSTSGVVYKGTNRFIHTYAPPHTTGAGGTISPAGFNMFMGIDSGNFTMVGLSAGTYFTSYNTGIGYATLRYLTTGYYNTGIGHAALSNITSGASNFGLGPFSLQGMTTGFGNTAVGAQSMFYATASNNVGIGSNIGTGVAGITTYGRCIFMGNNSGFALCNGNENILIGHVAGVALTAGSRNLIIGQFALTSSITGTNNLLIGHGIQTSATGANNEMRIGGLIFGNMSLSTVGIGIIPTAKLHLTAGMASVSSAPLKFTSGTLMTTPEIGAVEFLTDDLFHTKTNVLGPNPQRRRVKYAEHNFSAKSVDYVITNTDYFDLVLANKASAITLTLPTASGTGRAITVKNINTGVCTLTAADASLDLIDGTGSLSLNQWECYTVVDYATNAWGILARY